MVSHNRIISQICLAKRVKNWFLQAKYNRCFVCPAERRRHTASFRPVCYFRCNSVGMATAAAAQRYRPPAFRRSEQSQRLQSQPMKRVCLFGGVVLRLSGVVTEPPWRLASQTPGQVIHTSANVIVLTSIYGAGSAPWYTKNMNQSGFMNQILKYL